MLRPVALALLLLAPAALAQQQADRDADTVTLQPGQIKHPPPTNLRQGEAIAYAWRVDEPADASLKFSTHIHIGPQLVNLTVEDASEKQGRLVADRNGLYSLLWDNQGAGPVLLTYEFQAERAPEARTPFPWALAPLAGAAAALALRRRPA